MHGQRNAEKKTPTSLFLGDVEVSAAIRRLTKGSGLRCAVAFWGNGAADALFVGVLPPAARLICDVSMGGSNPRELERLGAPKNANLRHLSGLHAKVYLSDAGLITGSSNASNNGIGFFEGAKLVEACTFHAAGSEVHKQATDWFERIWKISSQVDEAALRLAAERWSRKGRADSPRLNRAPHPASLLDEVARDYERFRGVGFVFTSDSSTSEQRDETATALIKRDEKSANLLLSKSIRSQIRSWNVADLFSEWPPQDIYAWPKRFICAHKNRSNRVSYWFYERTHEIVLKKDRGMVLGTRPKTLRRELGFPRGREAMASADQPRLRAIFDHLGEDGHRLFENGTLFIDFLASIHLLD